MPDAASYVRTCDKFLEQRNLLCRILCRGESQIFQHIAKLLSAVFARHDSLPADSVPAYCID